MTTLVHEPQDGLIAWAAERLPAGIDPRPCVAMGVAVEGRLAAVALFGEYKGHQIQIAVAAEPGTRWLNAGLMRAWSHYVFIQLGCVRLQAVTAKGNRRARRLLEWAGFQQEGTHPRAFDGQQTAVSYGLLRDRCRWLPVMVAPANRIAA